MNYAHFISLKRNGNAYENYAIWQLVPSSILSWDIHLILPDFLCVCVCVRAISHLSTPFQMFPLGFVFNICENDEKLVLLLPADSRCWWEC